MSPHPTRPGRSPCRRRPTSSCCAGPIPPRAVEWRHRLRRELGGPLAAGADRPRLHPRGRLPRRRWRCIVTARLCELREIRLPLVAPFQTSFGTQTSRRILLVRAEVERDGVTTEGWGECVAGDEPTYSSEYVDGAALVIREVLAPRLADAADLRAADVATDPGPGPRPPDGQGGAGDGGARCRAARRAALVRRPPRRPARPHPERCQRRHPPERRRPAGHGRRLPRRRLRAHQAEDRTRLRPRAGRPRSAT